MKYETNPLKIREKAFDLIKEQVSLESFDDFQKKLILQLIQACGDTSIINDIKFSESAIEKTLEALDEDYEILCDTLTVAGGISLKYLKNEPICLLNKASVISQAKSTKKTRSMIAVDLWKPYLADSIILIGNEPTALFRLLDILAELDDEQDNKPALIIATAVGFIGASEAKATLWERHKALNIPCITLLGTRGGSDLASTILTEILKIHHSLQSE